VKIARTLLVLPGLAALAWGVVLFVEYAFPLRRDVFGTVGWIVGGPLINDGVIAPLTAVLGIVLARVLPRPWRVPVVAGVVITGVLLIVAFPLLWRPYGTPPMPGLHDGNPGLGLILTLAAVWLVVLVAPLARRVVRPGPRDVPPDARTGRPSTPGAPTNPPGTQTNLPGAPAAPPGARPGTSAEHPGARPTLSSAPAEPPATQTRPSDTRPTPPVP